MRFAVVGSGSKGNCLLVESGATRVLVDCGYSPKETKRRLATLGVDLRAVDALVLTHGHGDHCKGARPFATALRKVTYATAETHTFLSSTGGLANLSPIAAGRPFTIGALRFTPTATPHDAPGSVCFVVDDGDRRLGICTDLGNPHPRVADALRGCDSLYVELNYDPEMLRRGPYTERLKRRIASDVGHLSNEQGAALLRASATTRTSRVLLAHLSETNNTPALALAAARPALAHLDLEIAIAPQHHPTGWLRVRRSDPLEIAPFAPDHAPDHVESTPPPVVVVPPTPPSYDARRGPPFRSGSIAVRRQLSLFGGDP